MQSASALWASSSVSKFRLAIFSRLQTDTYLGAFFFWLGSFIDLDTTWKNQQQSTSFPICICKSEKEPSGKRWTVVDGN
jgi:hypothetical protein